ncbi:DUF5388 domain-containing protein [Limosilactobacillus reuteri]|uniref:Replication protein RepB n=1 Tax=Limosilactobacillus reuteri TaxID=1598 RepID=A0AB36AGZ5_LIMRT|nr:DUF5388 domain-containing protein [Limosilactobacillus reuteri]MCH5357807.1 hypothetical protein [Limosilactobacillus reuteri]MRG84429.1 hypothetical protein [Limosilactobacillus reuteri]
MKKLTKNRNPNYTTSISVSNNNRNKLIALANIYETTQKDLLSRLIDKEIEQLSFSDKNLFEYIFKAIKIKDNFKQAKKKGNYND